MAKLQKAASGVNIDQIGVLSKFDGDEDKAGFLCVDLIVTPPNRLPSSEAFVLTYNQLSNDELSSVLEVEVVDKGSFENISIGGLATVGLGAAKLAALGKGKPQRSASEYFQRKAAEEEEKRRMFREAQEAARKVREEAAAAKRKSEEEKAEKERVRLEAEAVAAAAAEAERLRLEAEANAKAIAEAEERRLAAIKKREEERLRMLELYRIECAAAKVREMTMRKERATREAAALPKVLQFAPLSLDMDVDLHWKTGEPSSFITFLGPTHAPCVGCSLAVGLVQTEVGMEPWITLDIAHMRVRPKAPPPPLVATEDDIEGTGEEAFDAGMRRNAMIYDAHDVDGDQKLDFDEFCAMVREREEGEHTEKELRARFVTLDADGSGQVDMNEYVRFALCDALSRSSTRVIELFKQWDEDGEGGIDKKEFRRAIKSLGFDFFANDAELDMAFAEFDVDKSGTITYEELNGALRRMTLPPKRALRKDPPKARGAALAAKIKFVPDPTKSAQEQLKSVMATNALQVRELLLYWDEDGNGLVDKKEFRKAISTLGIGAPRKEVDGKLFKGLLLKPCLRTVDVLARFTSPCLPLFHQSSLKR